MAYNQVMQTVAYSTYKTLCFVLRPLVVVSLFITSFGAQAGETSALELIENALDYWRSDSSYSVTEMVVHRPDWERTLTLQTWTRGEKDFLGRFTAPPKDAGNATLSTKKGMWIFTPKINQVIKLPASMLTQSWMGSDFSYNDLSRSDQIVQNFDHRIIEISEKEGHTRYTIESTPKADSPVVWGKQTTVIRDDLIILEETFYDQEMVAIKRMVTTDIAPLSGRLYPVEMRMIDLEERDNWTLIRVHEGRFNIPLPEYLFTLSNLRNPRPWSAP